MNLSARYLIGGAPLRARHWAKIRRAYFGGIPLGVWTEAVIDGDVVVEVFRSA